MNHVISYIIASALIVISCGSSKKQTLKQYKKSPDQSRMSTDSIPKPSLSPPGLPPGTARVESKVMTTRSDQGNQLVKLKIIQVIGMGPATPGLAAGDTLKIYNERVDDSLLHHTILSTISYRQPRSTNTGQTHGWRIEKIEQKNKN